MKRVVLIAGGTVGGLGVVLSVTPPQLSDNGLSTLSGASAATSVTPTPTQTPTQIQSAEAVASKKPVATKKAITPTKKSVAAPTPSKSAITQKSVAPAVTGVFTGDSIDVGYGLVQVKITVSNGKITEADVVQAPSGRSQRFTDYSVPQLRTQTLTAQSAAINGVSGASYTSYGWYKSLISALQKAGLATGV